MKIGLTYTGDDARQQFYVDWIKQHDADIEIITLHYKKNTVADLATCDGLVLSGGVLDIHPEIYGIDTNYANAPAVFEIEKDRFELALIQQAIPTIPVLGICRGLQLMNISQGGTLMPDLGTLNEYHTAPDSLVADKAHQIVVSPHTLLHNISSEEKGNVTSAHHQAIDVLGEGLVANAFSHDDNIIEGIEWEDKTNKPFMLCVQWHPERMFRINEGNASLSMGIRNAFVSAVKSS